MFTVRIRKKVLETHGILIICFEVLLKKIYYDECLFYALLNYFRFEAFFY
jgi:hypothetical protein